MTYLPGDHSFLPSASLSFGEAFYSNDPRIGTGVAFYSNDPRIGTGVARGTPISREHSYQLVVNKVLGGIDFRATLGHVTTEASLAKLDPDTGLQTDEGPGRNLWVTIAAKRYFGWGLVQASFSKADARDLDSGLPTPEAPRTIFDILGTVNRLPLRLQARAEFEEVGQKPLGDGLVSVPVKEFRGALVRSFLNDRMALA